jgi:hypothetical protein
MNKPTLFLIIFLFAITKSFSQVSTWDGGGDGTTWSDPLNWVSDIIPLQDDIVEFKKNAIVIGTTASAAQIKLFSKAKVQFLMNLNVGNGVIDQHAITLASLSQLTLGSSTTPFTFNLKPADKKGGINVLAANDSTSIRIGKLATLNLSIGQNGMNLVNRNSFVQNDGLIKIDSSAGNGIKTNGIFVNNGTIEIAQVSTDGINIAGGGNFMNTPNAVIKINGAREDGIEVLNNAIFTNESSIDINSSATAAVGNVGLSVGNADTVAQFINKGVINLNGGSLATARSIYVDEKGTFENEKSMNIEGGSPAAAIYNRGIFTNKYNAVIDLKQGRINVNKGSLSNSGYIKSNYTGSGVLADTLTKVENNAFYRYLNGNKFASGKGEIIDNGLNAKDSSSVNIDAKGSCTIDLANLSYPWYEGTNLVGNSNDKGELTLLPKSVTGKPVVLKTIFDSIAVSISNYCPQANIDGGVVVEDSLYIWDGTGDGTSWNDALNWDSDVLPKDGAFIEINKSAIITGTSNIRIANLKIGGKSTVVLDLDLTIGDGIIDQNAINIGNKCNVKFGQGSKDVVITIQPGLNKNGINVGMTADSCGIVLKEKSKLSFLSGSNAINLVNGNATFISEGNIDIQAGVKTGIKSNGSLTNEVKGSININQCGLDALSIQGGKLLNNGNINVKNASDDAIEINNAEVINNNNVIITMKNDASFSNGGIVVDSVAAFTNTGNGSLIIIGGPSTSARGISIGEFGSADNKGYIEIEGGNTGGAIFSQGLLLNSKGAMINLKDGRINISSGSFDNTGYIKSGFTGAGVIADTLSTVSNFAFYNYANSNLFANGKGTVVDTGLNVKRPINAKKLCSIDLGEVSYPWQLANGTSLGNSDQFGMLTFADKSLLVDSAEIQTIYVDFTLKVNRICDAALKTSIIDEKIFSAINVYPTAIRNGEFVNVNNLEYNKSVVATLMNMDGKKIWTSTVKNASQFSKEVNSTPGMILLKLEIDNQIKTFKIIIY